MSEQLTGQTRRVAVVGGNRIPFARSNAAYARASNQDMLTAALDGLVDALRRSRASGSARSSAGAVLKHARDRDLTRESVLGSRLAPETPAYDVQQACGTGLETAILVANKIALGQIDAGIAGGVDTASDAPIARQRGPARDPARRSTARSRSLARGAGARPRSAPATSSPRSRATRSRAPACRWASTRRSRRAEWGITPRGAGRARRRARHQRPRRRLRARLLRRPRHARTSGLERDQNLRPDSVAGEAGEAQAGLRRRRAGR